MEKILAGNFKILFDSNIDRIHDYLLPLPDDDSERIITLEGITGPVKFHVDRINEHQAMICAMFDLLPDFFAEGTGGCGGFSYLAGMDSVEWKAATPWTERYLGLERLFDLGLAVGKTACMNPGRKTTEIPCFVVYREAKAERIPILKKSDVLEQHERLETRHQRRERISRLYYF